MGNHHTPHHINCFERKYDMAFEGKKLSRMDIIDLVHTWVQVFLKLCDTMSFNGVETVELSEFGELQQRVE